MTHSSLRGALAAAVLALSGVAAGPVQAQVSAMDYDAAVPCELFQRWGYGGWTALAAATIEDRYPEIALRGFIAFYPGCGKGLALPGTAPVLILTGGKDDWTPAGPCLPMAESSRAAGRDVTAVIYPEARHHFAGAEVRGIVFVPDARRNKGATIQYNPAAHEDSEKQILRFLKAHLGK